MSRRRPNDARRTKRRASNRADATSPPIQGAFGRNLCFGAMAALLVARVFVPEDPGGQQGFGAAFVMLWLVLGCCVAFLASNWREKTFRWGWPETALAILVGWHTLSALVAAGQGAPRPAVNQMWDWIAIGAAYLLVRQLIRTPLSMTAFLAVMIGLAAALSMVAVGQSLVTIAADQAAYEAAKGDLHALYQLTGEWLPPDSPQRIQFENRLYSDQPTATFGLTNSLAAFLVPWIVLSGGVLLARLNSWRSALIARPGAFATSVTVTALVLMFACLGLTESRSAILATALGLAAVTVMQLEWLRNGRRLLVAAAGSIAILAIAAAITIATPAGRAAWTSAVRSVSFRWDYWRTTFRMILDHPFLGLGPGQFQDQYVTYKLPTASEEIQDPHNWLLEIWATAGTIAALAMLAVLAIVVIRAIRAGRQRENTAAATAVRNPDDSTQWIFAGGVGGVLLGVILAWLNGFPVDGIEVGLFVVGVAIAPILWRGLLTIQNRFVPLFLIAVGAMLVNLSAAGGISYPSVAESFWLLVAVAFNGMELKASDARPVVATRQPERRRWLPVAAWLVVMIAALWSEYLPVTGSRLQLEIADRSLATGDIKQLRTALEGAVHADSWSILAAQRLATQRFDDYGLQPTASVREMFEAANARVLELAPHRSGVWKQSSEFYAGIYDRTRLPVDLQTALAHAERAAAIYPYSSRVQAHLAKLWTKAAETSQAQAAAAEAIRLDDLMRRGGHTDRLLPAELREELVEIAAKPEN